MFLSTGRCGTQWLTAVLDELYPDVQAEHEPLGPLYRPRSHFRRYDDPEAILEVPEVAAHVARIAAMECAYIETGWPLFSVLPLLGRRLRARLRIVHLTRHPVPSALSHLAHKCYAGSPRDDAYTRLATLGPSDPNVFQSDYDERWDAMQAYERCLFWWTEVHAFGLELEERRGGVPFLRIASEEMLSGSPEVLMRLVEFMGLEWDERWLQRTARVVDRWHHHTSDDVDPLTIRRHQLTLEVARALGYAPDALDVHALRARYRGSEDPGLDRIGRFA